MSTTTAPFWTVAGESVTGASHARRGHLNQDSLALDDVNGARIVAVADGHGSARYFRSRRGAELATGLAVAVLREALAADPAGLPQRLRERVPREIVKRWLDAVAADLKRNHFADAELDRLAEQSRSGVRDVLLAPALAYGATLLAVLATEEFVFYLQLGDGDILAVAEDGTVSRPIPRDPALIANETTSLCMPDAVKHVHVRLEPAAPRLPALVMVSTDGYANSFKHEEAFLAACGDYVRVIREAGFDSVREGLKDWLAEVTAHASGDDVTVALLFRPSALAPRRPIPLPLAVPGQGERETVADGEDAAWLREVEHRAAARTDPEPPRPSGAETVWDPAPAADGRRESQPHAPDPRVSTASPGSTAPKTADAERPRRSGEGERPPADSPRDTAGGEDDGTSGESAQGRVAGMTATHGIESAGLETRDTDGHRARTEEAERTPATVLAGEGEGGSATQEERDIRGDTAGSAVPGTDGKDGAEGHDGAAGLTPLRIDTVVVAPPDLYGGQRKLLRRLYEPRPGIMDWIRGKRGGE